MLRLVWLWCSCDRSECLAKSQLLSAFIIIRTSDECDRCRNIFDRPASLVQVLYIDSEKLPSLKSLFRLYAWKLAAFMVSLTPSVFYKFKLRIVEEKIGKEWENRREKTEKTNTKYICVITLSACHTSLFVQIPSYSQDLSSFFFFSLYPTLCTVMHRLTITAIVIKRISFPL